MIRILLQSEKKNKHFSENYDKNMDQKKKKTECNVAS